MKEVKVKAKQAGHAVVAIKKWFGEPAGTL
jgi:hypothetical protein